MTLVDRALVCALPLAPRPLVERVAARYIAGPVRADALRVVAELNAAAVGATVDVLGELVDSDAGADCEAEEYVAALAAIAAAGADAGVSVKLTALGLAVDEERAYERLERIVVAAAAAGRFVRIDMEDASTTDVTLRLHRRLRAVGHEHVGVVLQSMLRRSLADARRLVADGIADVRVCKGIYLEPYAIAFADPELVRRSYLRICEEVLAGGGRLAAATHDERLVYEVRALTERHDPAAERHEHQMLLGVERRLGRVLVDAGARLRVYVPYGRAAHAYSIRRLQENPTIAGHVVRDLLRRLPGRRQP